MHKFGDINVHFDELVPENTVSMRKATYEHITGKTVVDPTLPVRGEPGAIPRKGRTVKHSPWVKTSAEAAVVPEPEPIAEEPPVAEEVEPAEPSPTDNDHGE